MLKIGTCLGDEHESVFYAATAIFSEKLQQVTLGLDAAGASKLFLNGTPLYADEKYREMHHLVADPFRVPATLHAGWNTLLLKIASDDMTTASFALRITTPAGEDFPGLRADPTHVKSCAALAPLAAARVESTTVTHLRALPMSNDVAQALGYQLRLTQDYPASTEVLRTALGIAPDASWLHWEQSQTLQADKQADAAREERDLARKLNARLAGAELDYLGEQKEPLPAAQFLKLAKELHSRFPASADILWALADAYDAADMNSEKFAAAHAAAKLQAGPDGQKALMELLTDADRDSEMTEVLHAAAQQYPNTPSLIEARADYLQRKGNSSEAILLFQRLLQLDSPWPRYRSALAALYLAGGQKALAAQILRAEREQCPNDAAVCAQLAGVVRDLGKKAEAITLFQQAIHMDPGKVDWREQLQVISGEQPAMNLLTATPADPILKEAATLKAPAATSAIVLLDEARLLVYPDYASDLRRRVIVKVFDDAGVKHFSSISLNQLTSSSDVTVEKARLLKADGKVQDTTDKATGQVASFPSLAPGDTIDLTYRVEDYHRGALAHQFWTEWMFAFSETPVKLSRFALLTPPQMPFQTREYGAVPKPAVRENKGWRITEWRMSDVPADSSEPRGTDYRDHGIWLDISTIASWRDIVNWYRDLADPRCVPDEVIRTKARELTKDANTQEEKIRAIVAFVARKIQYQSMPFRFSQYIPTEGKQVLREHYGDCKDKAALVAALLAAVNIPAEMVLVNGRDDGITPYLPSPRFSHAINCVQTEHGPLWVDATADKMAFGNLPIADQGVPALLISPTTAELSQTPILPLESNVQQLDLKLALEATGKLSGEVMLSFSGNLGAVLHSVLAEVPESKREMVLRMVLTKFIPNSTYIEGSLTDLDNQDKPMVITVKFSLDNATTSVGDFLILRLPWNQADTAEVFSLTTRTQDLDTSSSYGLQRIKMQLTLPAGYAPEGLKPKIETSTPWGSYVNTTRQEGNTLFAEWDDITTVMRVSALDYPKFREYNLAEEKENNKPLVLKKVP